MEQNSKQPHQDTDKSIHVLTALTTASIGEIAVLQGISSILHKSFRGDGNIIPLLVWGFAILYVILLLLLVLGRLISTKPTDPRLKPSIKAVVFGLLLTLIFVLVAIIPNYPGAFA